MQKQIKMNSKTRRQFHFLKISFAVICSLAMLASCGGKQQRRGPLLGNRAAHNPSASEISGAPAWLAGARFNETELCGYGVAGAAYNKNSPYPKKMSEERAVQNLAGAIETKVQEAIIDKSSNAGTHVRMERLLTVDDALLEKVAQMVKTEFFRDAAGVGPFAAKNFTYAHSCIKVSAAAEAFAIDPDLLRNGDKSTRISPKDIPPWIRKGGKQSGGRLCAVGFTLPMFHPDKTFLGVVEDIRAQLAKVIQTFVSSYSEDFSDERGNSVMAMTVATTDAVSKGAVVTHYWYDRDGIGPSGTKRSTYGYGCVYPVQIIAQSSAKIEEDASADDRRAFRKVRQRAAEAFDDLDAEIEKREEKAAISEKSTSRELAPPTLD